MAVVIRTQGNTGNLEFCDEATGKQFLVIDRTNNTIVVPAGIKVVHEDDPADLPPGTKVPLDQLLLNPQQDS